MAVSDISYVPPAARRASIQRWRRRSRVIAALRVILPGLIFLILAALAATIAYNSFTTQPVAAGSPDAPIRLVNPRFVGRDDRGRPFVLIAATSLYFLVRWNLFDAAEIGRRLRDHLPRRPGML